MFKNPEQIEKGLILLHQSESRCIDKDVIVKELEQASQLALFGIKLGLARLDAKDKKTKNIPFKKRQELANELYLIIEQHKTIWLIRNREGGLQDSAQKLEDLMNYLIEK